MLNTVMHIFQVYQVVTTRDMYIIPCMKEMQMGKEINTKTTTAVSFHTITHHFTTLQVQSQLLPYLTPILLQTF